MKEFIYKNYLIRYSPSLRAVIDTLKANLMIKKHGEDHPTIINDPAYLCPLCLQSCFYEYNESITETAEFTRDHFPPQSVGGRLTVCVCKECNNASGSDCDYSIKEYLEFSDFIKRKNNAKYPGKLSIPNVPGNYRSSIYWEGGVLVQKLNFQDSPLLTNALRSLTAGKKDWSFNIRLSVPTGIVIKKAILRAAYLFCFFKFGYGFVFSHTGKTIRDILSGNLIHPLTNYGVLYDESGTTAGDGLHLITGPTAFKSFLVVFTLKLSSNAEPRKVSVIVPGPYKECWNNILAFEDLKQKNEVTLSLVNLNGDLKIEKKYFEYQNSWNSFLE